MKITFVKPNEIFAKGVKKETRVIAISHDEMVHVFDDDNDLIDHCINGGSPDNYMAVYYIGEEITDLEERVYAADKDAEAYKEGV